jgi:hypothetical protein
MSRYVFPLFIVMIMGFILLCVTVISIEINNSAKFQSKCEALGGVRIHARSSLVCIDSRVVIPVDVNK